MIEFLTGGNCGDSVDSLAVENLCTRIHVTADDGK